MDVHGLSFNDIVGKDFFAIQVLFRVNYVTIEFKNRMHIPSSYKQTLRYDPTANKVMVKEDSSGSNGDVEIYRSKIKNLNDRIAFLEGEYSRLKKEISKTEDERIRYKKDNDNYYQFYQTVISKMNKVLEDHADTHGMTDEEQDLYDQINEFVMDKYNSKGGNSWMDDLNSIITIAEMD
jgi:chromosome segregation ATPase